MSTELPMSFSAEEAIRKARVLVEALGWIRQFRDRPVVIKLGGSALEETEAIKAFLTDVLFMETVGVKPILVHGGGKAISKALADQGVETTFVHGRRYTDDKTLEVAANVLAGEICESLVGEIRHQGGAAEGLSYLNDTNVLFGQQLKLDVGEAEPVDLGRVGEVTSIDKQALLDVCARDVVPVLPSIGKDDQGNLLNINADTAAAAIARLIPAEKLVFVSDVPGILLDKDDPTTLQKHLTIDECRRLIRDGVIAAGMVPKVEAAIEALQAGVKKVHLVDARMPHSILLEIFSNRGIGTELVP